MRYDFLERASVKESRERLKRAYRMEEIDHVPVVELTVDPLPYTRFELVWDEKKMLEQQLRNIDLTLRHKTDYVPFLEPWHGVGVYAAAFGCEIVAYDPWLADGYLRSLGVRPVALGELLATSKVTFVLAPPTHENRALLSRDLLENMPLGAVLVLISRAHVVDFDALTELALAGRIKAAIDVFPMEPMPLDHPIRRAPGTVLSAHRAGAVQEGLWEIGQMVVDDLEAIARGLPPQRLQVAQPETVARFASMAAGKPPQK